jgi:hypothetical protein
MNRAMVSVVRSRFCLAALDGFIFIDEGGGAAKKQRDKDRGKEDATG